MWIFGGTSRLRKLEEEIRSLEKTVKGFDDLPLKWENTLDLLKKMVARLNARDKALSATQTEEVPAGDTPASPPDRATGTHARMQEFRRKRSGLLPG